MPLEEVPSIRLVVDHSVKNSDAVNKATIWNPEDVLCGHLKLLCSVKDEPIIEKITVYFEGLSRNWIHDDSAVPRIIKAERKFISQAQDIALSDVSRRVLTPERLIFEVPFYFIISRMVARYDPESPQQCLKLPPSLELGDQIVELSTGRRFAQPRITYYLRAGVTIKEIGRSKTRSLDTVLPIIITPHTEELPPTETNDFPSEFKEQESKNLRRLIGTALGVLKISLTEPPPLSYENESTSSSTGALLKLEFTSKSSLNDALNILGDLKFTVYSLVRVKTFYSVKPFPAPPGQDSLIPQSDTRLRDDLVKLETRKVTNVSWRSKFNLGIESTQESSSRSGQTIHSRGSPDYEVTMHGRDLESHARLISSWDVPIQVDGRLLPTFCSAMVARYYTLIVRVKVSGFHQEVFDLEVPLQVVHTSPRTTQSSTGSPSRESFLEPRRASETSWFSNDSLESEAQPPSYYT